jgi:molybdenum cofactor cytidylyltransferase
MTGLIILAAGESSRLGKPKQNLVYRGKTLLQHAIAAGICSACTPVIVVLGAYADEILPEIEGHAITIVNNPDWQHGMSTSIKSGIAELQKTDGIDSAIIMLSDQPFADEALLTQLISQHQRSKKGIIACEYNNTLGVPVLFQQKYFAALLKLNGHDGAKKILGLYADDVGSVPFPKGAVDIDTVEDYEGLVG